jgi:hypothetical protein
VDYALTNRSGSGRTVMVTLPYVKNAAVKGADEVDFDAPTGKGLAVFKIEGRKQADRRIDVDEGLSRSKRFDALDWRALRVMAASPRLPAAQRTVLRDAANLLMEAQTRRELVPKREADLREVIGDLTRLRAHVAAIPGGDDDIVERILHKEDRVKALRQRVAELHVESNGYYARARATLGRLGTK